MHMKCSVSLVFALVLLSSAVFAQEGGGDGALVISVMNSAGQPLRNTCVTLIPKEGDIVFRQADAKGKVRVRNLASGNYRVVVKVAGYRADKQEVVVGGSDERILLFTLLPRDNK